MTNSPSDGYIGDFRDFCEQYYYSEDDNGNGNGNGNDNGNDNEYSTTIPGECPESNPPSGYKLATIHLASSSHYYGHVYFYYNKAYLDWPSGNRTIAAPGESIGTSEPAEQFFLLALGQHRDGANLIAIDSNNYIPYPSPGQPTNIYIYVNGNRYSTNNSTIDTSERDDFTLFITSSPADLLQESASIELHISYFSNDENQCTFYHSY